MSDERDQDKRRKTTDDVMHGRNLAGAEYGANEMEQTIERERAGRDHTDEAGENMVTEAEIEAREERKD